ncbi:MAG TPA: hypothetical protein VF599_20165 [Pyrinomonadaceae bacterium]|jgi:hypothetical protein
MQKILFIVLLLIVQVTCAEAQLWLSPVKTGDCVANRISTKKTSFVREYDKKYCARNLPDKTKERTCLENSRAIKEFSFFTDRCSESDYFIGINGDELRLRRISKKPGKPHHFIGTFAGSGYSVVISLTRPIKKMPFPDKPRDEDEVEGGAYDVLITVKKGARKKTYNGILTYGL